MILSGAEIFLAKHLLPMSIIIPGMLKYFDLPDLDRWTSDIIRKL